MSFKTVVRFIQYLSLLLVLRSNLPYLVTILGGVTELFCLKFLPSVSRSLIYVMYSFNPLRFNLFFCLRPGVKRRTFHVPNLM